MKGREGDTAEAGKNKIIPTEPSEDPNRDGELPRTQSARDRCTHPVFLRVLDVLRRSFALDEKGRLARVFIIPGNYIWNASLGRRNCRPKGRIQFSQPWGKSLQANGPWSPPLRKTCRGVTRDPFRV